MSVSSTSDHLEFKPNRRCIATVCVELDRIFSVISPYALQCESYSDRVHTVLGNEIIQSMWKHACDFTPRHFITGLEYPHIWASLVDWNQLPKKVAQEIMS